jgi:hypothetical protein
MNDRGHATDFATANTEGVTEAVEKFVAFEFAKALKLTFGIELKNVTTGPNPPDCLAQTDGCEISIELTELVDGKAIGIAKREGRTSFNDSERFRNAQWDADRFLKEINTLIDRKNCTYTKRGQRYDCLLIYTAEPWLLPNDVVGWLRDIEFESRESLRSVYLLMSYDPTYSPEHYPVFNLYGDLRAC